MKALIAGLPRRRLAAAGALAAVGVVVVAVLWLSGGEEATGAATTATATTEIRRQDLVENETVNGTLGYGDSRQLTNRLDGTVTWLPDEGAVVRTDGTLFRVDDSQVILLDGKVPAYRNLRSGISDGSDVAQLERNLRVLGYDDGKDIELDSSWDAGTTAAVKRWQEAHDFEQTGEIELGRVLFAPGNRRVGKVDSSLGGDAGRGASAVMTTTSSKPVVTVDLDTSKVELAERGTRVRVELPSGQEVRARVTEVSSVATQGAAEQGEEPDPDDATIEVTIELAGRAEALDQAPVSVDLESERRKDVLAVPVTALLAQAGGKFAVEVRDGAERRLVAVEPGLYAGGFVEIAGAGLRTGMKVTDARV